MTEGKLEALPPHIAELLERESRGYAEDPALKSATLARIELAVALAPPLALALGSGAALAANGLSAKAATAVQGSVAATTVAAAGAGSVKLASIALVAFVAGTGAGSVGLSVLQSQQPKHSSTHSPLTVTSASLPSPRRAPPQSEIPVPVPASPPVPLPASVPASSSSSSSSSAPAPSAKTSTRADLERERELLDAAHAALSRGRYTDALAAAERHAREWPRGYLSEEREAVLIQALLRAGRASEASSRAATFRKIYPNSMSLPAIDSAFRKKPSDE
jgi:RNA polymerase sigma-70 factor (ECF subfamily)